MANMSYCRFQNTHQDFRDCLDRFQDPEKLSDEELRAAASLLKSAGAMVQSFIEALPAEIVDEDSFDDPLEYLEGLETSELRDLLKKHVFNDGEEE